MKIAHIITNLSNGGAEKIAVELANAQAKQGHEAMLIVFDKLDANMIQTQFVASNVRIQLIKRHLSFSIWVVFRLLWFLWQQKVDVVHTHKPSAVVHTLLSVFCFRTTHFVHTIHSELAYYKHLFVKLNKLPFYRRKVINVCLTHKITQDYQKVFPKMTFQCVKNGIAPLEYNSHNIEVEKVYTSIGSNKKLLFIGRNAEPKNLDLLFETIRSFEKEEVSLVCIGLDKQDILQHYAVEDIIDMQVFICGNQSNVGDYLYYADALILSSKNEGMPLVVIEAMSMGVPIISTAVGGVPEMVKEGINGFLASEVNKVSMKEAIKRFLSTETIGLKTIADNNRKQYKHIYSVEKSVEQYLQIYKASTHVS